MEKITAPKGDASHISLERDIQALVKGLEDYARPFIFRVGDNKAIVIESIQLRYSLKKE